MSIALTGFLTGFAKGAKERIEKEQEENEALIQGRLKLAATNRLKSQQEREAQRELLNKRYDLIKGYLPENATEEQKLALISTEEFAKEFAGESSKGKILDLNKFILLNKDKIPEGFTSVRKYIDSIPTGPAPLAPEQMQQAFGETRGFLGARTGVSAGRAEKLAQQYGAPAAELLAYEKPQERFRMPEDMARMNVEMLREEKVLTPEQRIQQSQNAYIDTVKQYGADSPEAEAAKNAAIDLASRVAALKPEQETFTRMLDTAKVKAAKAKPGTPEYKAALAEVDRLISIGKKDEEGEKLPTLPQMRSLFSGSASRALVSKFGPLVGKEIIVETGLDGVSTYKYTGADPTIRQQVEAEGKAAIARQYRTLSDASGRPLNANVRRALIEFGVEFDNNNVPIFGAAPPPAPATAPGASPVGAARVTPGTAPTAPAAQPTAQPTAQPRIDIAAERREAERVISQGADRAAVAARFKQRTGQNL